MIEVNFSNGFDLFVVRETLFLTLNDVIYNGSTVPKRLKFFVKLQIGVLCSSSLSWLECSLLNAMENFDNYFCNIVLYLFAI